DSKELQAPKTIKGDVDKAFEEKAPTIKGYKLDTTKSDETYKGKFTEQGQTYYFVYVGDGSTPSNKDNNNTSDNSTPSDNKDSNNESGKTVPKTAPEGSYYDDNGNLLIKDGVLIDSKGIPQQVNRELRHQTDYTLLSLPNDLNTWVGTFGIQNNPSPMTMRLNPTQPSTQPTSQSLNISISQL
ncbi:cell wall surface anchor family protein, partial [Neobacillus bataviensis LMG 21833]